MTTTRRTAAAVAAALLLALSACATPRAAGPHPAGPPATAGPPAAGDVAPGAAELPFPTCADIGTLRGDPAVYRDEPRYGNPMELVDAVRTWAEARTGFVEIWLDRDHHGWVHVGFAGDVDVAALQGEAEAEFTGEGVVVVELPHTETELHDVGTRVTTALRDAGATFAGWGPSAPSGLVGLHGLVPDPEAFATLEQFAGEPLCVDVLPADSLVPEGEQPTQGAGWRLLGHERDAGAPYRTGVATDEEQLTKLWRESGLDGAPGEVDWQREIVVWFGAVWGSGCPVRLDDVAVTGSTLHGQIVVPGWPQGCGADANAHAFVVAVERDMLPAAPFHVQLTALDPPPGAPEERTVVVVDLRAAGSRADAAALQPGTPPEPIEIEDGHDSMPAGGGTYVWHPRPECAGVVIGPIDSSLWRLVDDAVWLEEPGAQLWLVPLDDDGLVAASDQTDYVFVRTDSPCDPPS